MTSLPERVKARRPARTFLAAYECPRKGVQAARGFSFRNRSRHQPVLSAAESGDGILIFKRRICNSDWSASVLAGPGEASNSGDCKRGRLRSGRRAALAAALQICAVAALALAIPSCTRRANESAVPTATREVTDEAGHRVRLPEKIDRIVSLAPNLTEIVYAVGAGEQLVGDTEYCDYPLQAKSVTRVGDTMHPSIERIIALKPQVVLVSTASQLEAFT